MCVHESLQQDLVECNIFLKDFLPSILDLAESLRWLLEAFPICSIGFVAAAGVAVRSSMSWLASGFSSIRPDCEGVLQASEKSASATSAS